ncbi:MAG: hypothetical protein HDS68_02065 [Bacteroidales bacterium]|nr:hypothetical protein [Bacteroidales bacterium]
MTEQDSNILKAMLKGDFSEVTDSWLHEMKARYPFFPLPEALKIRAEKTDTDPQERAAAIARITSALGGGENAAASLLDPDEDESERIYPESVPSHRPTTENTIDRFLKTYGNVEDNETETLEKLIFNPVADYSQQLAREAEALPTVLPPDGNSQDDRINRFILSVNGGRIPESADEDATVPIDPPASEDTSHTSRQRRSGRNVTAPRKKTSPEPAENSLLSESLAKIYIKTKRYERAYEILSHLSLAFPEKNAYFADQLRFLRKLIIAQRYSQNKH